MTIMDANARAIAAAPQMHEALGWFIEMVKRCETDSIEDAIHLIATMEEKARAALALADRKES
jgi:hypothetical protein